MSAQRGRACACCAASKRKCLGGERPCRRCISVATSLEEATRMCVELPDRRTKKFVALRKKVSPLYVTGEKRPTRGWEETESTGFSEDGGHSLDSSVDNKSHSTNMFSFATNDSPSSDNRMNLASVKRRAVSGATLAGLPTASLLYPAPAPACTVANSMAMGSEWAGSPSNDDYRITAVRLPRPHSVTGASPVKFNASSTGFDEGTSAYRSNASPAVSVRYGAPTELSVADLVSSVAQSDFSSIGAGLPAPNKPEDFIENCTRKTIEYSTIPTLRIVHDNVSSLPRTYFANAAWLELFAVTREQLNAMVGTLEPPRKVYHEDLYMYNEMSQSNIRSRVANQTINARFVASSGRVFAAQESSQLEYLASGRVRAVTIYYSNVRDVVVADYHHAATFGGAALTVSRSRGGGITMPATAPATAPPVSWPAATPTARIMPTSIIPLDAELDASIRNTMKKLLEENWLLKSKTPAHSDSFAEVLKPQTTWREDPAMKLSGDYCNVFEEKACSVPSPQEFTKSNSYTFDLEHQPHALLPGVEDWLN